MGSFQDQNGEIGVDDSTPHPSTRATTLPPTLPTTLPPSLPTTLPPSLPTTLAPSLPTTLPPSLPTTLPSTLPLTVLPTLPTPSLADGTPPPLPTLPSTSSIPFEDELITASDVARVLHGPYMRTIAKTVPKEIITPAIQTYSACDGSEIPSVVLDTATFTRQMETFVTQLPEFTVTKLLETLTSYFKMHVLPVMLEDTATTVGNKRNYFININLDKPEELKNLAMALKAIYPYLINHNYKYIPHCTEIEEINIFRDSIPCLIVLSNLCLGLLNLLVSNFPEIGIKDTLIEEIGMETTILLRRCLCHEVVRRLIYEPSGSEHYVKQTFSKLMIEPDRLLLTDAFAPFTLWLPIWDQFKGIKTLQEFKKYYHETCPVCLDQKVDNESMAVGGPCLHFMCIICLEKLACAIWQSEWKCPICRQPFNGWTSLKVFEDHFSRGWKRPGGQRSDGSLQTEANSTSNEETTESQSGSENGDVPIRVIDPRMASLARRIELRRAARRAAAMTQPYM